MVFWFLSDHVHSYAYEWWNENGGNSGIGRFGAELSSCWLLCQKRQAGFSMMRKGNVGVPQKTKPSIALVILLFTL